MWHGVKITHFWSPDQQPTTRRAKLMCSEQVQSVLSSRQPWGWLTLLIGRPWDGTQAGRAVWVSVNQLCLSRSKKSTFEGPRGGQWLCLAHSQKSQAARGSCVTSQLPAPGWTRGKREENEKTGGESECCQSGPSSLTHTVLPRWWCWLDTGAQGRTTWHSNLALICAAQQRCRWKAGKKSVNTPQNSKITRERNESCGTKNGPKNSVERNVVENRKGSRQC